MFVVNYAMVNSTLVLRSCDLFNPTGMSRTVLVNVGNAKEGLAGRSPCLQRMYVRISGGIAYVNEKISRKKNKIKCHDLGDFMQNNLKE